MSVNNLFFLSSLIISVASLLGCDRVGEVEGKLLYSGGGGVISVAEFSAVSGLTDTTIYLNPDISAIDSIIRLDNGETVFGECNADGDCNIKRVTPGTRGADILRSGHLAGYLADYQSLFFYDFSDDGDMWLFVARLDSLMSASRIAKKPEPKTLENGINRDIAVAPIPISEKEVVFVGPDAQLWIYNAENGSLDRMNIDPCYPYLWVENAQQLLCGSIDSGAPFVLNVFTNEKKEIPSLKGGYGFVYVPQHNAVIYGKTRLAWLLHEASDIFWYSLEDGSEKRLGKDIHLRYGVWLESERKS